jgi:hypothetical protein
LLAAIFLKETGLISLFETFGAGAGKGNVLIPAILGQCLICECLAFAQVRAAVIRAP